MSSMCAYKLSRRLHQRLKSGTEVRKTYASISCIPVDQMLLNVIPSNLSVRSEAFVTIRVPHCYVYRFFTSIQCTPASYLLGAIVDRDGNWWPYAVRTRLLFWLHRGSGNITLPQCSYFLNAVIMKWNTWSKYKAKSIWTNMNLVWTSYNVKA
jgi:hypothetical protein